MDWLSFIDNGLLHDSLVYFIYILCTLIFISAIFCLIIYVNFSFLTKELSCSIKLPTKSTSSGPSSREACKYEVVDVNFQDSPEFVPFSWQSLLDDVCKNGDKESQDCINQIYDQMIACKKKISALKEIPSDSGQWTVKMDSKGVKICSIKRPNEPAIFRVETIIDAPPQWVLRAIGVCVNRGQWDTEIEISDLKSFNNTLCVRRTVTGALAAGAISSRDFIDLVGLEAEGDVFRFVSSSFEETDFPEQKGSVRGKNYGSGVFLEPCMERHDPASNSYLGDLPSSRYTGIVQVDIKGWIPQSIIDLAMTSNVEASLPPQRQWLREHLQK